jgi:predicted nucleic acid-binding protein
VILVDTGFWLALANSRDRHHAAATRALSAVQETLITTWPVLTETSHLLVSRLGSIAAERLMMSAMRGAFQIFELEQRHLSRIVELMGKYRDLPMDLADASLVIVAESTGNGRILSTDQRDFRTYRWKNRKPFRNLLAI